MPEVARVRLAPEGRTQRAEGGQGGRVRMQLDASHVAAQEGPPFSDSARKEAQGAVHAGSPTGLGRLGRQAAAAPASAQLEGSRSPITSFF